MIYINFCVDQYVNHIHQICILKKLGLLKLVILISQINAPNSLQICRSIGYLNGETFKEPLKQGLMLTKHEIFLSSRGASPPEPPSQIGFISYTVVRTEIPDSINLLVKYRSPPKGIQIMPEPHYSPASTCSCSDFELLSIFDIGKI